MENHSAGRSESRLYLLCSHSELQMYPLPVYERVVSSRDVACVCLFQTVMEFRHPDGRLVAVVLPGRSLLVMKGESRYLWTHG